MKAGSFPIILETEVGWRRKLTWRAGGIVVPLADYAAILRVRHPTEPGTYLITLTEEDDEGIVLSDTSPNIEIIFTAEQVNSLDHPKTTYRLDLTPPDSEPFPLLGGPVLLERW